MQVNKKELEKLIETGLPTAVLFGRPSCGTCTNLVPQIGDLPVVMYNLDDGGFEAPSTPTLKIYKDGRAVKLLVGVSKRESIERVLKAYDIIPT